MEPNLIRSEWSHTRVTINHNPELSRPKKRFCRYFWRCWELLDIIILLLVILLIGFMEYGFIPTVKVGFFCKDPFLSYPYKKDTITNSCLIAGSLLLTMSVVFLVEILRAKSIRQIYLANVWKYYKTAIIGLTFLVLITALIKTLFGAHRPHFFNTCRPDANENCTIGTYIEIYHCTNTKLSKFQETNLYRSFPSGHAAVSMFVSLYSSFLISKKIPKRTISTTCRLFLITLCLIWTVVCSFMRITDHRHHWYDVLGGAILGFIVVCYVTFPMHNNKEIELFRREAPTNLIDMENKEDIKNYF